MTKDCYHGDFKTRENPKEPLFIISDDMIRQWRGACIKVAPFQEEDQCKDCEYRGKGARKGCCDFDDNAMERIFRSRPLEQEKRAAVNAVLDELQKWIDETHKEQEAIFKNGRYVHPRIIKAMMEQLEAVTWKIAELRQQAEGPQQGGREE